MSDAERTGDAACTAASSPQLAGYGPQLVECRERLRDVVVRHGGIETAAMVGEAKLLRATLVFAAGSPLGAPSSALVPAALSIELLHLASLVHDDIIDDAAGRRGMPALHVRLGLGRALVVGDSMIVAAFDVLSRVRGAVPPEIFGSCVDALTQGALLCCRGQLEELDSHQAVVTEHRYIDLVAKKTGALFSVAASLGALMARAGGDDLAALAAFGTELGIAYQLRDDFRDRGGEEPWLLPTGGAYARSFDAVRNALDRVPEACVDPLQALVVTCGVR